MTRHRLLNEGFVVIGDSEAGIKVPEYVGAELYGFDESEMADYVSRTILVIPKGEAGGVVLVRDAFEPDTVWIDIAAAGRVVLPNLKTARAVAVWLYHMGYHYAATQTYLHPKLQRYWQRFGMQCIDDKKGIYSLCLLPN